MPRKAKHDDADKVTALDMQCVWLVVMSAVNALTLKEINLNIQHAKIKQNLLPSFNKMKAAGKFPAGANLVAVEATAAAFDGKSAKAKYSMLKCDMRDRNDITWQIICEMFDKQRGDWKSGKNLAVVIECILEALWNEKERLRVENGLVQAEKAANNGKSSPNAKGTPPAKPYQRGIYIGPPWWLCFHEFWNPHGVNPSTWLTNPKLDSGPGNSIAKGPKELSRATNRSKEKQTVEIHKSDVLEKYRVARAGGGGGSGGPAKEIMGSVDKMERAISKADLHANFAAASKAEQKAVEYAGRLEEKIDDAEDREPAMKVPAMQRLTARKDAADLAKDGATARVAACQAEIDAFLSPPIVVPEVNTHTHRRNQTPSTEPRLLPRSTLKLQH